jgi:cytoskeletal protein CcmA (bactofilin family)
MSQTLSQITVAPATSDIGNLYLAAQPAANLGQRTGTVFATTALTFNPSTGALTLGATSTAISGAVTVTGAGTFTGAVSTTGLTVTGAGTFTGAVSTTGLTVTGAGTFTGAVSTTGLTATNGLIYNGRTITQSTTIPAGYNAVSVGPITQATGVVVTQASGTRWVIL